MKLKRPMPVLYGVAAALAVLNILWYLALNYIYLWFGHPPKYAAGFSFVSWILTLPFTFWSVYYWVQNRLFPEEKPREH